MKKNLFKYLTLAFILGTMTGVTPVHAEKSSNHVSEPPIFAAKSSLLAKNDSKSAHQHDSRSVVVYAVQVDRTRRGVKCFELPSTSNPPKGKGDARKANDIKRRMRDLPVSSISFVGSHKYSPTDLVAVLPTARIGKKLGDVDLNRDLEALLLYGNYAKARGEAQVKDNKLSLVFFVMEGQSQGGRRAKDKRSQVSSSSRSSRSSSAQYKRNTSSSKYKPSTEKRTVIEHHYHNDRADSLGFLPTFLLSAAVNWGINSGLHRHERHRYERMLDRLDYAYYRDIDLRCRSLDRDYWRLRDAGVNINERQFYDYVDGRGDINVFLNNVANPTNVRAIFQEAQSTYADMEKLVPYLEKGLSENYNKYDWDSSSWAFSSKFDWDHAPYWNDSTSSWDRAFDWNSSDWGDYGGSSDWGSSDWGDYGG
ncbi:MAG: hypothetical protein Q4F00_14305, partial [bacterium]|nr:hypothetical protein [bacterium]